MASIFEEAPPPDAENIADESTLSIPDFISKRGGVKIDKDIENGQISARGELVLEQSILSWRTEDSRIVKQELDLMNVQVTPSNTDPRCFTVDSDSWRGDVFVKDKHECSEWVSGIRRNGVAAHMRHMMCTVFSGPVFGVEQPSTTQLLANIRRIYRCYCKKLQEKDITRKDIKALNILLLHQKKTFCLRGELLDVDQMQQNDGNDDPAEMISVRETALDKIGTRLYSLQQRLAAFQMNVTNENRYKIEIQRTAENVDVISKDIERARNNIKKETALISSRKKRQFDFYILYDEDQDNKLQSDLVDKLTLELENRGFIGQHRQRDCPPGSDKGQYHRNACIESDIVICLLGKKHMKESNGLHIDNLISAKKIKTDQAAQDHIVVLLYDHDQVIYTEKSALDFLRLDEPVSTKNEEWIPKILNIFTRLPKENTLKRLYFNILPEWCAPLLRGPLPLETSWLDVFLSPEIVVKSIETGTCVRSEEIEGISDVLDIFKYTKHGGRVIIIADGGMGKSAIVSHMTRSWSSDHIMMKKYGFVFLTPQRLVNNITEDLERIICGDLKLLDESCMAKLRNLLKSRSDKCLFLVDGFDELQSASRKEKNTFIKLMKKDSQIARKSTVVVTTRPHSADEVLKVIGDTYMEVRIEGLPEDTVIDRAHDILTQTKKHLDQPAIGTITDYMPLELLRMPLLFNIATYVWKCQKNDLHDKTTIRTFSGMTDIFGAILNIMIGIQEEKGKRTENVNFYASIKDIPSSTRYLLQTLAAMSYECLGRGELIISTNTLQKYHLNAVTCGQIGFLHISSGPKPQGNFVHNLFMEYCAGFHIADDKNAMRKIVDGINQNQTTLFKTLGLYSNALLFAVGIRPEILEELSTCKFQIPMVKMPGSPNIDVDLSLEAQLLQESSNEDARKKFCQTLMKCDLSDLSVYTTSHRLNAMGYEWMQKELGVERCLNFLKKAHHDNTKSSDLVLHGDNGHRYITDTLLLSQLPYVRFRGVTTLHVCHAKMTLDTSIFSKAVVKQADRINKLDLDDIDWTIDQLIRFLCHIPALSKLEVLILGPRCRLKPIILRQSSTKKVNVHKIVVKSPILLDLLGELMNVCQTLVIGENARLKKKRLHVPFPSDRNNKVSELYLQASWGCNSIIELLTVTCSFPKLRRLELHNDSGSEIPDELIEAIIALRTLEHLQIKGHTSQPSIVVDKPTRNAIRFKGKACLGLIAMITRAWRMKTVILQDTTLVAKSSPTLQELPSCVKEITLGRNKRFDIDTIGVILSLLAPKGIEILTIDKGCVLQTTSAAASQQRMICPVEHLFIFNTLDVTCLHDLVALVGNVRKLYLGGAPWMEEIQWRRNQPLGCQVVRDTDENMSLPSVNELVLCEVRGVRSMFQRIMLPNVTKIEVCDWAKHDNVDETVEDNLLRHVCPGANVEYSRWAKPVYQ